MQYSTTLLFICLISCSGPEINQFLINNGCNNVELTYAIEAVDTLTITVPANSVPSFGLTQTLNDKYLIGLMKSKSRFEIYDLENEIFLKSIQLDPNFITKLGAFYVHSLDSIFITQEIADVLLVNGSGEIVNKWDLSTAPVNWESPDPNFPGYYFYTSANSVPYYDSLNQNLHVTFNCFDIWHFDNRAEFQMHGVYNIQNNNWLSVFGMNPGIYSVASDILYPFAFSQPFQLVKGDTTYITFPMDHNIYVYDNKKGKLLETKCGSSQYVSSLPQPLKYNEETDGFQLRLNMINKDPVYGKLNYHTGISKFSRIAALGQPLKRADGTLNNVSTKNVSIIIFDQDLNIISEYLFDPAGPYAGVGGDHGVSVGAATSDGFIGSFKSEFNTTDDLLRMRVRFEINEVD